MNPVEFLDQLSAQVDVLEEQGKERIKDVLSQVLMLLEVSGASQLEVIAIACALSTLTVNPILDELEELVEVELRRPITDEEPIPEQYEEVWDNILERITDIGVEAHAATALYTTDHRPAFGITAEAIKQAAKKEQGDE